MSMKNIFLLGTMLGVATTAFAFGGMFNHGSKSSTYKGGVDAIGVHFGGEKKTADITADTPSCPEHSTYSEQLSLCLCSPGYYMFNQKCHPTKATCEAQGGYWCINGEYSTCGESEEACYALCPEDKKCNGTCCADGNVCHHEGDVYQCCNEEQGECCNAGESVGYGHDLDGMHCLPLGTICGQCHYGELYTCRDNFALYRSFYGAGHDKCDNSSSGNEICLKFDEMGNCRDFASSSIENPLSCYWKDSNGNCRIATTKCPAGQLPYCGICCKGVDSEGIAICSGPGLSCCSGKVTYGEGTALDTCEE